MAWQSFRQRDWALGASRIGTILIAIVILLSALDKALHYESFLDVLGNYRLVPPGAKMTLGLVIIILEVGISAGLLVPKTKLLACVAGFFLFIDFALALMINLLWGTSGSCGCWFSLPSGDVSLGHILMDLLFALALAQIYFYHSSSLHTQQTS
jgi:hypothetical protein